MEPDTEPIRIHIPSSLDAYQRMRAHAVHHVAIEVDQFLLAHEREFWPFVGFSEYHALHRGMAKRYWLINVHAQTAVNLLPRKKPVVPEVGHIALRCPDFDRTVRQLRMFKYEVQREADFFGGKRAYTRSPSGHWVELIERAPSIKAGVPTDEEG